MTPLHEFLRIAQGVTAAQMFAELSRLRRLGSPWEGVPGTQEEFQAGLETLLREGLAERSGKIWLWKPGQRVGAVTQGVMFAD